jgi:hypothetical protein
MKIRVQTQPYNKVVKLKVGQQARISQTQPGEFIAKPTNVDGILVQQGEISTAVLYSGVPTLTGGGIGTDGATGATGPAGPAGATGATGASGSGTDSLVSKTNAGLDIMWKGTAVYLFSNTSVKKAQANDDDKKRVLGLVYEPVLGIGSSGQIMTEGLLTLLPSEWLYVVADIEGFVGDQYYYLSPLQEGKITRVAPSASGEFVCPIGYSVSATQLLVRIDLTVAL